MEGMDGLSLLARVRQEHPDIPVVMVTAVHDISVALTAIRNGAYDYLLKPFEREQLLAIVRRAMENRRLKLENLAYQTKLESLVAARTDMLRRALADLERSYDITLEALGDALDLKDAETEGHSKRVTAFTIAIARAMELPHDHIRVIARGAFLHDVGKMAIPDAILRKPGQAEPRRTGNHAPACPCWVTGCCAEFPFCARPPTLFTRTRNASMAAAIPAASKGDQIPLGARIFAIADTFDAITSDRPYRAAQSIPAGRREIERHSGRQFDPEIVQVFLSISEQIWQDLRTEIEGPNAQVIAT